MRTGMLIPFIIGISIVCLAGCGEKEAGDEAGEQVIGRYPLDSMDDVITRSGVTFDEDVSSDGAGSLRITTTGPTVVRLFETGDIDIENAKLVYRAKLRTEDMDGRVYLEMYCGVPGYGESFSRGIYSYLTGTNDWVTEEIPFFLKTGQNPERVKLNLVVDGAGTVWIDDIRLLRMPLP